MMDIKCLLDNLRAKEPNYTSEQLNAMILEAQNRVWNKLSQQGEHGPMSGLGDMSGVKWHHSPTTTGTASVQIYGEPLYCGDWSNAKKPLPIVTDDMCKPGQILMIGPDSLKPIFTKPSRGRVYRFFNRFKLKARYCLALPWRGLKWLWRDDSNGKARYGLKDERLWA